MPWQLASQASSEKPSENGWFQRCINDSTAQIKGEGFPAHLEQLGRPGYQAWKQQNGITWGYWGQNRIQVNNVSSRILKVKKFWNLVFLTHLVAVESAVKTPFASLGPSSIWGHTGDCGVRPLTHGGSSRVPVPRTPLRNEARVTPHLQGRHWPPSLSGHTSPLVHLFFLGKLPDPLSGGPLLGNPS